MKRMVIAIFFLLLACFLAIFGFFKLQHICISLTTCAQELVETAQQAKSPADCRANTEAFLEAWEAQSKWLGAFVNHGEMDELDILVRGLSEKTSAEELQEDATEIVYHLQHLQETEKPKFKNIF